MTDGLGASQPNFSAKLVLLERPVLWKVSVHARKYELNDGTQQNGLDQKLEVSTGDPILDDPPGSYNPASGAERQAVVGFDLYHNVVLIVVRAPFHVAHSRHPQCMFAYHIKQQGVHKILRSCL